MFGYIGTTSKDAILAYSNLASVKRMKGDIREAEEQLVELLNTCKSVYGDT